MSRLTRELQHWERLYYGGHCTREQFREAAQELGCDDRHILLVIGPEPEEIEAEVERRKARAA